MTADLSLDQIFYLLFTMNFFPQHLAGKNCSDFLDDVATPPLPVKTCCLLETCYRDSQGQRKFL